MVQLNEKDLLRGLDFLQMQQVQANGGRKRRKDVLNFEEDAIA